MELKPFWEDLYANDDALSAFGEASPEVYDLGRKLPFRSRVLDLGSGDGRNAICLATLGHQVSAVDISAAALEKLQKRAVCRGLSVHVTPMDLGEYEIKGEYELVVAYGCLHLLHRPVRNRVLTEMQMHTARGGYNIVVVFTDSLEPPEDLRPWMHGIFKEGEIFIAYEHWAVEVRESYILSDEHPGGIRHQHAINKVIAQRP